MRVGGKWLLDAVLMWVRTVEEPRQPLQWATNIQEIEVCMVLFRQWGLGSSTRAVPLYERCAEGALWSILVCAVGVWLLRFPCVVHDCMCCCLTLTFFSVQALSNTWLLFRRWLSMLALGQGPGLCRAHHLRFWECFALDAWTICCCFFCGLLDGCAYMLTSAKLAQLMMNLPQSILVCLGLCSSFGAGGPIAWLALVMDGWGHELTDMLLNVHKGFLFTRQACASSSLPSTFLHQNSPCWQTQTGG